MKGGKDRVSINFYALAMILNVLAIVIWCKFAYFFFVHNEFICADKMIIKKT